MQHVRCTACGSELPLKDSLTIQGEVVCEPCCERLIAERQGSLQPGDVTRNVDSTICGWCGHDEKSDELPLLSGIPTCGACDVRMRNWPYPRWIKLSFAALLVLGIGSIIYNYRFVEAVLNAKLAHQAMRLGDVHEAALRMNAASDMAPEAEGYRFEAKLFEGMDLLSQNKSAQALPLLIECQQLLPTEPMLAQLVTQAQIGVAFDTKDYDEMLRHSQSLVAGLPVSAYSKLLLASAYACKYAATGEERFKSEALNAITAADALPDADTNAEYKARILHRLHSRKILTKAEFDQQFPEGWNPQMEGGS
jgi:hypothetical protein